MAILLVTSPDGKQRMLLNTDLVFAYIETGESVSAVSHTGHALEIPMTLDDLAVALEDDEQEVMAPGETD